MSLYVKVDGNQHRLKLPASATKTEIKAILGLHGVAGVFTCTADFGWLRGARTKMG